ncbi:ABC-F family ATP-binding cassette domain-containing protein [Desulfococcaceae bacterium OttesenSCG-928-F15]|nr:ABC-F family ATP-binding cassette domain-containing protein [Desulfococcaceae bacterium OttesenSCG-928-F15]
MATVFSCKGLSKTYGEEALFENLTLFVSEGDRLGLIGPNGSGKSSLIRMAAGSESPDAGEIIIPKNVRYACLSQEVDFPFEVSIGDVLAEAYGAGPEDPEGFGRIQRIIGEAGFPDLETSAGTLSGGWKKRLAIVRELVRLPDLLFLDEPTNHLDVEGILWLEERLKNGGFTLVLVSHDRRLMDRVCTKIAELGRFYPEGFFSVSGGYERFFKERTLFLEQQAEEENRLENKMRREAEWLSRMPKARTTKAKYRIEAAARLEESLSLVRARNRQHTRLAMEFDTTERKSRKLMEIRELGAQVDGKVLFSNVSMVLSPGTRMGLAGINGAGKSTFMQVLAGEKKAGEGEIRMVDGLSVLYFDQARESLNPEITLKEALCPDGDSILYRGRNYHIMGWAARFLFRPDQVLQPVGKLSGGERARVLLANLMRKPSDILLLDEPTNDLDIPALEVLEESLLDFPGAVVLVSHDRYLMDRVCDRILGFDGVGGTAFFADMDQWTATLKKKEPGKKKEAKPEKAERKKTGGKLSYHLQRELDGMEKSIEEAEKKLSLLTAELENPENQSNPEHLTHLCQRLEDASREVERLYNRWDELEGLKAEKEGSAL